MDNWSSKFPVIRVKKCEKCEGTGAMVNEFGMIKMCDSCGVDHKEWQNRYGTLKGDNPTFYLDEESKVKVLVDRSKDYILLPNGKAIERLII